MKKLGRVMTALVGCCILLLGAIGIPSQAHVVKADDSQTITDAALNDYISKMTLDEKIGQMFVSRTPQDTEQARADVAKYHLGGLIVYGADFTSVNGTTPAAAQAAFKNKLQAFQDQADLPLLIGVDQEGGTVSRLSQNALIADGRAFPSPQTLFAEGGMPKVLQEAKEVGTILKNLGINWNYAPVADSTADTDSFIYPRTFGQDYTKTADYITQVIPAWQSAGIAATVKHFPGYGSAVDTHTDFAVVSKSEADFEKEDLLPFKAGINAGVDSVMIAHIVMEAVDPVYPSSLSRKVVTDLLRNKLGYNGLIITDALGMGAITKFAAAHNNVPVDVLAVQAGNDCIMNNDYKTAIPQIHAAVTSGQLSEAEINQHVFRILNLKRKLGLLKKSQLETKKVQVDSVSYDKANKTASVTGTVIDSNWQTGEPLMVKNEKGDTVLTVDVGAGGKFDFTIPMLTQVQNLTLTTGLPAIEDARLTVKAIPEVKVDKTSLKVTVDQATKLSNDGYLANTWDAVQTALTTAKKVLGDANADQTMVNRANESLAMAISSLRKEPTIGIAIKTNDLRKTIYQAILLREGDYTTDTWAAVKQALVEAGQVLFADHSDQATVDHAQKTLETAIANLKKAPTATTLINLNDLKEAIHQASLLNEKDYTAKTWAIVKQALIAARQVLSADQPGQTEVAQVQKALQDAMSGLKKAPINTSTPDKIKTTSNANYVEKHQNTDQPLPSAGEKAGFGLTILGVILVLGFGGMAWRRKRKV